MQTSENINEGSAAPPPLHIEPDDASFRASVVGASEVAALFDCHKWLTRFELYHRKRGTIATPAFDTIGADGSPDNERIHWGVVLEDAIVAEAMRRWGYTERDAVGHLTNGNGLGGHPDRRVICPVRGPGILETKMVDWLERKKWGEEPPLNYLLQGQTYAGLDGAAWVDLIVLVGGNKLERFQYDFRPGLYAEVERRVASFWRDVRNGVEPKPDYSRDGGALIEAIGAPDDSFADLRDNIHADQLALTFHVAKARAKQAEQEADEAKAALIHRIGAAGSALTDTYRINCSMTKGSAGTLVTEDMVGTHIGARKGYRQFAVKEIA